MTKRQLPRGYRAMREQAGMSAQVAATRLGCAITTLFNYERGKTSPNSVRILEMANLYGCSVDDLIQSDLVEA